MILSFHPLFEGDHYRLCAGRDPDETDLAAIRRATAVILPQGCRASLYQAARQNCARIFPNYDARFAYPGKIGQCRLFQKLNVPHPPSDCYANTAAFHWKHRNREKSAITPIMVKMDWGGEGDGVFPVSNAGEFHAVLKRLQQFERTGQTGFIVQQRIPTGPRSLRVVVIGHQILSYWRVASAPDNHVVSLAKGGNIDDVSDRHLIQAAEIATQTFCRQTGINLAGFDFLFCTDPVIADPDTPLYLEINYYFGRRGIGGSEGYYQYLQKAIEHWLADGQLPTNAFPGDITI